MKIFKTVLIFVLVIALAGSVSFSFMSNNKATQLSSELKQEKQSNQDLKSQLDKLQKSYDQVKKDLTTIEQTKNSYKGKVAFLTFDDGPSIYTEKLLDTLEQNNVHATFFVVGTNVQLYPDTVKREYADGNTVGIHCWDHDYSVCYASLSAFLDDFNHIKSYLTTLLGVAPTVCRFPGDTDNTVSHHYVPHLMQLVVPKVKSMNIKWFDWNVESGDSESTPATEQEVADNVVSRASQYNNPIILCHDIKKNTVAAIPQIITRLKALGYSFAPLSRYAPTCQFKAS